MKELLFNCRNLRFLKIKKFFISFYLYFFCFFRKIDFGYCPNISITGLLSVIHLTKNLQYLRISQHSSILSKFLQEQLLNIYPYLTLEMTNY